VTTRRSARLRNAGRGLILATLVATQAASGQTMVTEVVPAGFRSAEELAAVLRPLVPAPGSVNGFSGQLIIKTTPENMAELKRVIWTLDKAPANLLVTVKHTLDAEIRRDLAEAQIRLGSGNVRAGAGSVRSGPGARIGAQRGGVAGDVRVERSIATRRSGDAQSVRVLEGKQAFIHSGESVPVGESSVVVTGAGVSVSEGTRYEEFGAGFFVRPRLSGDSVILDITPSRRQRRGDGSASVQEASTSVSGVLGHWMEIGGVSETTSRIRRGVTSSRIRTTRRDGRIFVKVERLN
jgi:hypothetical protein